MAQSGHQRHGAALAEAGEDDPAGWNAARLLLRDQRLDQRLRLAQAGMAVVFISSEMSEVVRVAHRIVVLRDRRKVGELPAGSSEDAVYELIAAEHV